MKTPIKDALQVVAAIVITGGMATAMALPNTTPSNTTSSVKAQLPDTPHVASTEEQTAVTVAAKSTEKTPPKQVIWQDNPQQCDQNTQYISEDAPFNCIDKPVQSTAPAVVAAPTIASGDCDLAYNYDWPKNVARAVCMAESHGNAGAIGDTRVIGGIYAPSCGLMQIRTLPGRPSCDELKNGTINMNYAYQLYLSSGFTPWSMYNNGMYLKYL